MTKRRSQLPIKEEVANRHRGKNTIQQPTTPIGEWLNEECQARGLSWAEASRRAGVDRNTVSLIMRGQNKISFPFELGWIQLVIRSQAAKVSSPGCNLRRAGISAA